MKVEEVPFQIEHALTIIEINKSIGIGEPMPTPEMVKIFVTPGSHAFTLLINDYPIACGGVVNMMWSRGELWLLIAPQFHDHLKTAYKHIKEAVPKLARLGSFRRIQAVTYDHCSSLLNHLGFDKEGLMKCFGPQGQDAVLYSKIF